MNDQNVVDKFVKNSGKKLALGCGISFFGFIFLIAALYVVIRHMNTIQGLFDNIGNDYNQVEKVLNAFSLQADGSQEEELYKFLNELASKYNKIDLEPEKGAVASGVVRDADFDLPLILATLHYEKLFEAKVYQEGTLNYKKLTNKEVSSFVRSSIKTEYQYKMFYKWAYLMLGTPYSIPDINLRGLTGSLTAGKVVSKCVQGGEKTRSHNEVINMIVDAEYEFAGKQVDEEGGGFFSWLLGLFGGRKQEQTGEMDSLHNSYRDELVEKVNAAYRASQTAETEPIEAFLNFDQYNPDLECAGGTTLVHRYVRTMNYDQYKIYLEKVFLPENYLDCENCLYKDASQTLRDRTIHDMIRNIFASSQTFYLYADLEPVDYDNLDYEGEPLPGTVLTNMTSPLGSNSCVVTSPYTALRVSHPHYAIDSIVTNSSETIGTDALGGELTGDSLVAIADGVVKEVVYLTDRQLEYNPSTGWCKDEEMPLSGGIYVVIEHDIGGKKYQSRYFHLKKDSITVKVGDTVVKGQKIAEIGSTGCSTGPHLHFEVLDMSTGQNVNPNNLFSNCENWEASAVIKLPTTDRYYTGAMIEVVSDDPNKATGIFPLEEYVTGVVKAELYGIDAPNLKAAYQAQAIAARTYALKLTNWGANPIENGSSAQNMASVDIEGDDKKLYELVLETQGMVLTHTSEIFLSEYANFPCQIVEEKYLKYGDQNDSLALERASYVIGFLDHAPRLTEEQVIKPSDFPQRSQYPNTVEGGVAYRAAVQGKLDEINESLAAAYASTQGGSCSKYYNNETDFMEDPFIYSRNHNLIGTDISVDLYYLPNHEKHSFSVGADYIYSQFYGHNRGMTQIGAVALSEAGHDYVAILNQFYQSNDGNVEIITAPGLVTVFGNEDGLLDLNSMAFDYGETLPGSDEWHTCRAPQSEDDFYEQELKNYINSAERNAIQRNDINPLRAKVVAAAYWLAYNPYFKVQYQLAGKYPQEGVNNKWGCRATAPSDMTTPDEVTVGLDCNAFVRWAFAQIGKSISIGGDKRAEKCSKKGLTVGEIASVVKIGDVLVKHAECHGSTYGHVAIVFSYDRDAGTFSVIHASGYKNNITITEYNDPGDETIYNWVLSMESAYGDE